MTRKTFIECIWAALLAIMFLADVVCINMSDSPFTMAVLWAFPMVYVYFKVFPEELRRGK